MKAVVFTLVLALLVPISARPADRHGGQEVEAGGYHVELLAEGRRITVYLRDKADKPIGLRSVKAGASVFSGKERAEVELAPEGEALKGEAPFAIAKNAKVVVTFSVAGAKMEQARFSLGAKQDHGVHKH